MPAFVPSASQRRLLDYLQADPNLHRIERLCKGAGVSRTSYYRWCQDPDFRRWFAAAWSSQLVLDGAILVNIARLKSNEYPFWKALFDLVFDPKGLGLLQKWQQQAAQASPLPPLPVPSPSQADQQLSPESLDKSLPSATPLRPARLIQHFQEKFGLFPASEPTLGEIARGLKQLVPVVQAGYHPKT